MPTNVTAETESLRDCPQDDRTAAAYIPQLHFDRNPRLKYHFQAKFAGNVEWHAFFRPHSGLSGLLADQICPS